jgi:HSP20 family protein
MIQVVCMPDSDKLPPGMSPDSEAGELPVRVRVAYRTHVWRPPTDVYETEGNIVVRIEVAGMQEEGFSIILDGRYLSVHGVRIEAPEKRAYYQMEIPFGEFRADIELPRPVSASEIEAFYSNGFLRVVLPKARPQKVPIEEQ